MEHVEEWGTAEGGHGSARPLARFRAGLLDYGVIVKAVLRVTLAVAPGR